MKTRPANGVQDLHLCRAATCGRIALVLSAFMLVSAPHTAFAADTINSFSFEGRLFDSAGNPLNLAAVNIRAEIYSYTGNCMLYQETHSGLNLSSANVHEQGVFSIRVGGGIRGAADPGLDFKEIFQNTASLVGSSGCIYTPTLTDMRYLRIHVDGGAGYETLSPDFAVLSAPGAAVAQSLQGKAAGEFIQVAGLVSQANVAALVGGGEASALHHHDSRYVRIGATGSAQNLGSADVVVDGKIGIGTATPSQQLHVRNGTGMSTVRLEGAGGAGQGGRLQFFDATTERAAIRTEGGTSALVISTNGTDAIRVDASQKVSLTGALFTGGVIRSALVPSPAMEAALVTELTTCADCSGSIFYRPDTYTYRIWDSVRGTRSVATFVGDPSDGQMPMWSSSAAAFTLGTPSAVDSTKLPLAGGTMTGALVLAGDPTASLGAATKQYVDSSLSAMGASYVRLDGTASLTGNWNTGNWNIGIGVPAPAHRLDVAGDVNLEMGSNLRIGGATIASRNASFVTLGSSDPLPLKIFAGSEAIRVQADGKVGVGTTAPGERLEVAGAIKIGNADAVADGTIRWTGSDFEGRKTGSWVSLTATGGGEANTASNIGTGGVGIFANKSGADLRFRNINSANARVVVTNDSLNNEIDIDISEANLSLSNLGGTLPVEKGGTGSSAGLINNRIMISSAGKIVERGALSPNRALMTDANGLPSSAATTVTELNYLSGVTSNVQTQLDGKLSTTGGSMTGPLDLPLDGLTVGVSQLAVSSGKVGIGTTSPAYSLDVGARIDAIRLPVGGDASRPPGSHGAVRYNLDTKSIEAHVDGAWRPHSPGQAHVEGDPNTNVVISNHDKGKYIVSTAGVGPVTYTLPSIDSVPTGWQITIVRPSSPMQSIELIVWAQPPDRLAGQVSELKMRARNLQSVTITKTPTAGSQQVWSITNQTFECAVGEECLTKDPSGGAKQIFVGTLNGTQYFTTPGGCSDNATPTCPGTMDSVVRIWQNPVSDTGKRHYTDGKNQSDQLASTYSSPAAKYCEDMVYAGYDDWYLPARQELYLLLQNSAAIGGFVYNDLATGPLVYYWSSTESNPTASWAVNFTHSETTSLTKSNSHRIRCIRRN